MRWNKHVTNAYVVLLLTQMEYQLGNTQNLIITINNKLGRLTNQYNVFCDAKTCIWDIVALLSIQNIIHQKGNLNIYTRAPRYFIWSYWKIDRLVVKIYIRPFFQDTSNVLNDTWYFQYAEKITLHLNHIVSLIDDF